jgi:hypothetical protein
VGAQRALLTRFGRAQTAGASEAEYDHRLYNQSAGMTAGFGNEEAYNVYDKPLFKGTSQIYKPTTRKEEYDTQALVDNLQKGGDGKEGGGGRGGRPVQFEKEADPFGSAPGPGPGPAPPGHDAAGLRGSCDSCCCDYP